MISVWDPLVRAFHWALAASFAVAWLSSEKSDSLHNAAGYTAGALVALRVVWGFLGPRYARFAQFERSPDTVIAHLRAIKDGSERRYIATIRRAGR
jgi:cytochrome b